MANLLFSIIYTIMMYLILHSTTICLAVFLHRGIRASVADAVEIPPVILIIHTLRTAAAEFACKEFSSFFLLQLLSLPTVMAEYSHCNDCIRVLNIVVPKGAPRRRRIPSIRRIRNVRSGPRTPRRAPRNRRPGTTTTSPVATRPNRFPIGRPPRPPWESGR